MRLSALVVAAALGLTVGSPPAAAEDEADFVFTDAEGHIILRFAGAGAHLDTLDWEEVFNVSVSTMVHDRLKADAVFEAEPIDAEWAHSMERRIERHVREAGDAFPAIEVECRSVSCRLVLDHAVTWRVAEHQSVMGTAQRIVDGFILADAASFEPIFLIIGHYQEPGRPYVKLFLRRAAGLDEPPQHSGR